MWGGGHRPMRPGDTLLPSSAGTGTGHGTVPWPANLHSPLPPIVVKKIKTQVTGVDIGMHPQTYFSLPMTR
jgi:hypothetical protein